VQTCICPSWCHCHLLSLASVKSRLVLPFWYRLTRVVPEKGPLNGCVCVCVSWYDLRHGEHLKYPAVAEVMWFLKSVSIWVTYEQDYGIFSTDWAEWRFSVLLFHLEMSVTVVCLWMWCLQFSPETTNIKFPDFKQSGVSLRSQRVCLLICSFCEIFA